MTEDSYTQKNHTIWLYLYTPEEKVKLIYYSRKEHSGFQGRVVGKGHKKSFGDENNLGGYTGLLNCQNQTKWLFRTVHFIICKFYPN